MKKDRYLFVHFREKRTPDGEQVHFALSEDGFHWTAVNHGRPVLYSIRGDKGVRDFTIARLNDGRFIIVATDLSLAYGMPNQYHGSWGEIALHGSHDLVLWESKDLVHWSEQKMITLGGDELGCRWAPDIIYDKKNEDYLLHWSSPFAENGYTDKGIFYVRTKDFKEFSPVKHLYQKENSGVIDSCMIEENGVYYLFVKSENKPRHNILLKSSSPTGPFERVNVFDEEMKTLKQGVYEAPTAFLLIDGRWCLMLDYYGEKGKKQGYVPFVCSDLKTGIFRRADEEFSFPYGFKHGTVLPITKKEYDRIASFDFEE